jgi:hypothetical protein
MNWRLLRRGDVAGFVLVAIVVCGLLFMYLRFPGGLAPHWLFGPDWDCTPQPESEPICFKKP